MKSIPSAWLGFSEAFLERDELVARVCMKCPDMKLAETLALECGYPVTHGLCPTCQSAMIAELKELVA